jgi:hypothetical protein
LPELVQVCEPMLRTLRIVPRSVRPAAGERASAPMFSAFECALLDELVEYMDSNPRRVKRIVNDLREFSHVSNDEWLPADLNQGLESTLNVVWNDLKYKADIVRELFQNGELKTLLTDKGVLDA